RYPFLWSDVSQPAARWHAEGEGPPHYFAEPPAGAWAELLRHERTPDQAAAATVHRALWPAKIEAERFTNVSSPPSPRTAGRTPYQTCQDYARRLRARGARRLAAPSAALIPGGAGGREMAGGTERATTPRDGRVIVVFGEPEGIVGWKAVE